MVVFDSTKDEEIVYRLVTSEESDVTKGLISTTSPIGRGLVGKKVGDVATIVTPNGKRELEILKLTTIHDEEGLADATAAEPEAARAAPKDSKDYSNDLDKRFWPRMRMASRSHRAWAGADTHLARTF